MSRRIEINGDILFSDIMAVSIRNVSFVRDSEGEFESAESDSDKVVKIVQAKI